MATNPGQPAVARQRPLGKLVQPRAHHAAVVPQLCNLAQIELEILRSVQNLIPLCIRLEHAVLDPVVHHLHIVPRPGRTDVGVAVRRRQRPKNRLAMLERRRRGTDHETVTVLEAPDAAARPDVDELDSLGVERRGAAQRVAEI